MGVLPLFLETPICFDKHFVDVATDLAALFPAVFQPHLTQGLVHQPAMKDSTFENSENPSSRAKDTDVWIDKHVFSVYPPTGVTPVATHF